MTATSQVVSVKAQGEPAVMICKWEFAPAAYPGDKSGWCLIATQFETMTGDKLRLAEREMRRLERQATPPRKKALTVYDTPALTIAQR